MSTQLEKMRAAAKPAGHTSLACGQILSLVLLAASPSFVEPAQAQGAPAATRAPVPVELTMSTVHGRVVCGPRRMRLPAGTLVELAFVNRSRDMILLAAPRFLRGSRLAPADGALLGAADGVIPVPAGTARRLILRSPVSGEYGYACRLPGRQPQLESTGFFIVLPPPRRSPALRQGGEPR